MSVRNVVVMGLTAISMVGCSNETLAGAAMNGVTSALTGAVETVVGDILALIIAAIPL